MSLILRPPWDSQPQDFVGLNFDHPRVFGARHWWHLSPQFAYRDLIGTAHAVIVAASPGVNKDGASLRFPGGIAYANVGNPGDIAVLGEDWTLGWQGYLSDSSTRQILVGKDSVANRHFHFQLSGGTLTFVNQVTTVVTATSAIPGAGFYQILYRRRGSTHEIFVNGKVAGSGTSSANYITQPGNLYLGAREYATVEDSLSSGSFIEQVWAIGRAWSDTEIFAHYYERWSVFEPRRIIIPVSAAGGGSTGTLAKTNANDTSNASGTTTVVGTLARTNANDTSAASGTTTIVGTLARTNAADTSSASGTTTVTGTLAKTNANDTLAASGAIGNAISGTASTTNAADTLAASGTTTIVGTLAKTNAADTSAATGTTTVTGTVARTNANDTVAATGAAGTITGTVAYTNNNDTVSASGSGGLAVANQGAGRPSRPRRRVVVEIDGQDVIVGSAEEATALLEQVREEAEEKAETALKRAATVQKRPARKVLADARKALKPPTIEVRGDDELQGMVSSMLGDISALYKSTLDTIEIGALLRKRQQDDEDEDDVLLMLL